MINDFLSKQIRNAFLFEPTLEQGKAIDLLAEFLQGTAPETIFVLRGFAGTGKTSLVGALVKTLDALKQKVFLLAPTGRAAKVFTHYAGHSALTIHKKIYRQKSYSNELSNFSKADNLHQHTLFIVDEASMISNAGLALGNGTGRLLDDLIQFVYAGQGCRLLLLGDTAQLPPVGEEASPALNSDRLRGYGLTITEVDLSQVVRQASSSGILWNATKLREAISAEKYQQLPSFKISGFADVKLVNGDELIETISAAYSRSGMEETTLICRSNKRANLYNKGIRASILYREEELNSGDLLMIVKNNYFWTATEKEIEFIANGDVAVVQRVRGTHEMYGCRFADVTLSLPDYNDFELDAKILLETLHVDSPAFPKADNDKLFYTILEDYAHLTQKGARMGEMKKNPHYNALQVKYAYAITCHKSQGGQWKEVFIDQGYAEGEYLNPDYFKWLYTAITRATETLYLINYPTDKTI